MSQQINLFNPIYRKQKKVFAALPMVRALAVLLAGMVLLVVYGHKSVADLRAVAAVGAERVAQKQARLAVVNAQYPPRQRDQALALELARAEAELRALRGVGDVLRRGEIGNTAGYSAYFKALARQTVDGMWLTAVSITGAGNEIGVQGRALEAPQVTDFMLRLTRESVLRGKFFESLRLERPLLPVEGVAAAGEAGSPAPFVAFSLQSVMPVAPGGRK